MSNFFQGHYTFHHFKRRRSVAPLAMRPGCRFIEAPNGSVTVTHAEGERVTGVLGDDRYRAPGERQVHDGLWYLQLVGGLPTPPKHLKLNSIYGWIYIYIYGWTWMELDGCLLNLPSGYVNIAMDNGH